MATERRRKILVADDDADVRGVIADYLSGHGCEVIEATNGLEALLQVKRGTPDAVVLDVHMPRLGGLEAIPRIRAFDPSIVIVVMTGDLDARLRDQARRCGASAVLSKPIPLPELAAAVAASGQPAARTAAGAPAAPAPPSAPTSAAAPSARPIPVAPPAPPAAPPAPPVAPPAPPAPPAAVVSAASGALPAPSAPSPQGGILIVDDDPAVSDVVRDLLSIQGYRARSVSDAASALREVVASAPDIVLLDISMPGLNGIDALPALRAVAPRTVVIMVSGTTDSEVAKRALAYGAFDYVTKPIDIAYLTQSVETAFRLRALDS